MKKSFSLCFTILGLWCSQAQDAPTVDFKELAADVTVIPEEKKVTGKVSFVFDVLAITDSIFIDAQNMQVDNALLNGKKVQLHNDGKRIWLISEMKVSQENLLEFTYTAFPRQTMYFVGWENPPNSEYEPQVWTQGQGKYTSHWLPSFDDTTEKLVFDMNFVFPKDLEVASNGKLIKRTEQGNTVRWEFNMNKPMSSYLVAVAAGNYYKSTMTTPGSVPIHLYFYQGEEEKLEPTYRYTQEIFDFLEEETGFSYPWEDYKQIPVRNFLYSGMENTAATIFSDTFVTDSIGFFDRNYIMVNAHEMAHQWFGNTVTAASGEHHWLQEGFSTYYALLAEKEIHGDDYYYWKLFQSAEQLKDNSDKGKGESLMNPKASSLTFYQKGAWALHILRERLGEEAFRSGVKNYLQKHQFQSVTTDQFLEEMEKASGKDLSDFKADWLVQSAFQGTEALNSLRKSEFVNKYLSVAALRATPLEDKRELLSSALAFPLNDYIGQEVVQQLALEDAEEVVDLYRKAFESNNRYVRQNIALTLNRIPRELKSEFESLLEDESYLSIEAALYNLWMNFPEDRSRYLEKTKNIPGFSDKNVRTLWLALNLATPEYHPENQSEVFQELSGYTHQQYPYLLRQNGFKYLYQLNSFTDENLKDLLEGTQHYVSRFRSFCRDMVKQLVENPSYVSRFLSIQEGLPEKQQEYLERVIKK